MGIMNMTVNGGDENLETNFKDCNLFGPIDFYNSFGDFTYS